ncbi:MAG: hypothetical protein LBQ81_04770 [Zoogloeaceae bacterium]|jgi:hypothetical protein|nr:hypothetical protein [Zoogloeaceae bacterium]
MVRFFHGLFALTAAFLPGVGQALEANLSLRVAPEFQQGRHASPYYINADATRIDAATSRQDLELKLREGGFFAQGALRMNLAEGGEVKTQGITQQIFYDGKFGQGFGWTVGRKVLSWGVGFALRPLDVVQRENRRDVNPPALTGVTLAALEHFTANQAWTLAWLNPGAGRDDADHKDEAIALRWYRFADNDDLHAVARISRERQFEAGFGATRVLDDEWSFYGAALYSRRYYKTLNPLAETHESGELFALKNPRYRIAKGHSNKIVLGAQWTGRSGWSALAEAFYDGEAYRRSEWRHLDALTQRQRAAAAAVPALLREANAGWSSQAYLNPNLLRENVLLRVSYDNGDGFKPYGEMLLTPTDGGRVATLGARYVGDRQEFSAGWRNIGGPDDSVYKRSPVRNIFWLEWRLAIF